MVVGNTFQMSSKIISRTKGYHMPSRRRTLLNVLENPKGSIRYYLIQHVPCSKLERCRSNFGEKLSFMPPIFEIAQSNQLTSPATNCFMKICLHSSIVYLLDAQSCTT